MHGHYPTRIASFLAAFYAVRVLIGRPSSSMLLSALTAILTSIAVYGDSGMGKTMIMARGNGNALWDAVTLHLNRVCFTLGARAGNCALA